MKLRIGQGIDIHAFVKGRPLVLGGVEIEHDYGLQGHSDADALTHAICDALLGAANLGDIGEHFSDEDPAFENQNSQMFLTHVMGLVKAQGWNVVNVDVTVMTEAPKLMPHKKKMQQTLCATMNIGEDQLSIKATRAEKLGSLGRREGLMALAVVLLSAS